MSCCFVDVHLGSRVMSAGKLNQGTNSKGALQESSSLFFNQAKNLWDQGKINSAKRTFLKMFQCQDLNAEDFAEAGKLLTEPRSEKETLNADLFARQFLKQARELGSKDTEVYYRLGNLYLLKMAYSTFNAADACKKAETAFLDMRAQAPEDSRSLDALTHVYSLMRYPDPNKAVAFGLELTQKPETESYGNSILAHLSYRFSQKTYSNMGAAMVVTELAPQVNLNSVSRKNQLAMADYFFKRIIKDIEGLKQSGKKVTLKALIKKGGKNNNPVIALSVLGMSKNKEVVTDLFARLGLDRDYVQKTAQRFCASSRAVYPTIC